MKNNRTFLEKLLDGSEVEWKPLGDVCNFQNGFAFKSSLFKDNGSPIVRITNIDGGRVNLSDVKYFLMDDYNTDMAAYEVHKDDILIAMSGATTGKIGFYNYEHTSYLNQRVGKFLPNTNILNNRYLYHYLLSKVEDIYIISGGGAQPNLSSTRLMSEVFIPIPPLSVQTEIVKILDALTALTSELTSELTLRRKQYEYYREKLLSEEELGKVGFEWRALKDILIRTKGTKITAAEMKVLHKENAPLKIFAGGKTFALVNYSDIPEKDINKNPSIIVKSRGIIEFEYYDKPFSHKNEMWSYYSNDKNINIKYIYYVLKNQEPYFQSLGSKMQMPQIATPDTDKYLVPIPPPYIQTEIVKFLDKFANLTNSISEGLPLAIEQSQKWYEYYRELLLSF